MAQRHYNNKWHTAQLHLTNVVRTEFPLTKPTPDRDRDPAFITVSVRYVRYIMIYQKLQRCYDYMVHPQKRQLIDQCLQGVSGRLVELRHELIRLDLNTYSYLGNVCHDLKLEPASLEIQLAKSIYLERVASIRKRTQMLDYIINSMHQDDDGMMMEEVYTVQEAVLLIQKNQRGFLARRRSKAIRKRGRGKREKELVPLEKVNVTGVLKFQSLWRGHAARKRMKDLRQAMDRSLNMLPPPTNTMIEVAEETIKFNRFKEAGVNQDNFNAEVIIQTEQMLENKGPSMADAMRDEIMQWILECRGITNEFPELPTVSQGGSQFLFKNMTVKKLQKEMELLQEEMAKKPDKKKPGKGKDKGKDKEKDKGEAKPKKKKKPPTEFLMKPSKFLQPALVDGVREFSQRWYMKDERHNLQQAHDQTLLIEDVEKNVETIVRLEVDELMRQELQRLQVAVDQQRPGKPRKDKKPKQKKKKGKKMKDLTPGVPVEELFKELVLEGIIQKVPDVFLRDFVGAHNLIAPTDGPECLPDLGDIRKLIFDLGILPMSTPHVRHLAPLVKSLLLLGPLHSGKTLLAHTICSELGATFFDLSAANLEGKFPGKNGPRMLINKVMKVGKEMEPSVIFIDNCDLMFSKKLTREQKELKPARIRAPLAKALTFLGPDDRILLVGTSRFPFNCKPAPWLQMFQHLVTIYPPSHSSRYMLWRHLITENRGIMNDNFSLSALAKVSQGYTGGNIHACIMEVLTEKRRSKQHVYPIKCKEFVVRLAQYDPVFQGELTAFKEWLTQTPAAKKKEKIAALKFKGKDFIHLY